MDKVARYYRVQRILDFNAGHIIVSFAIAYFYVAALSNVDARVCCTSDYKTLYNDACAAYRVDAIASRVIDDQVAKDDPMNILDRNPIPGIMPDLEPFNVEVITRCDDCVGQFLASVEDGPRRDRRRAGWDRRRDGWS